MSRAFELVQSFRHRKIAGPATGETGNAGVSNARSPKIASSRRKRAFAAFSAALFVVSGGFFIAGTNIPGVIAQEGGDAASFFRADRARMRASRTTSSIPVLNIFGTRNNTAAKTATGQDGSARRGSRRDRNNAKLARNSASGPGLSGAQSVCVRLCDGFHFPVGAYKGPGDNRAYEAICSGLCPGAPTRLYVLKKGATDISEAVSIRKDGRSYAALPVALRHTAKRDNTCSCRAPDEPHMALVSLRKDFTLRQGDAVMITRGMRVFRGAKRWPYRTSDFTSLKRARGLSRTQKRTLYALERASGARATAEQARRRAALQSPGIDRALSLPAFGPIPPARPVAHALVNR